MSDKSQQDGTMDKALACKPEDLSLIPGSHMKLEG